VKVIYIAGKYRGPNAWAIEQNIRAAEDVAARVWAMGMVALCPHANSRHMDGVATDEHFLAGTLELLGRCDAVVLVPGWEKSSGTRAEIAEAQALCKPVFGLDTGNDLDRSVPIHAAAIAAHIHNTMMAVRHWIDGT
jgi:nucleoside 2-deoxyribosyltransferase